MRLARHGKCSSPITLFIALIATALVSIGCGVDGPSDANLTVENRDDLAVSSADALARIVTVGNAFDALSFLDPSAAIVAASAGEASICKSGGANQTAAGFYFDECVIGDLCVFDGAIEVSASNDGDRISISFLGLDVLCSDLPLATLTDSFTCVGLTGDNPDCGFSFGAFVGLASNRTLDIGDFEVEEEGGYYYLDAEILDAVHGVISVEPFGDALHFDGCGGGVPDSGEILISGAGDESTYVEFSDCDVFNACFRENDLDEDPDCDELSWSDYLRRDV